MQITKEANWEDGQCETEWKSLLEKIKKMYHMNRVLTHWRKFVLEIVPLWLKIEINAFTRAGLCAGGLIRGVMQAFKKRWTYLCRAYKRRNTLFWRWWGQYRTKSLIKYAYLACSISQQWSIEEFEFDNDLGTVIQLSLYAPWLWFLTI